MSGLQLAKRTTTVTKRPMGNIPAHRRAAIADAVLKRYIAGEQVAAMASEYKTSDVTIYALLLRERERDWADIQTARALARLERFQEQLETAADGLSLARCRELVRSAQWELERLLSRLYGQKQEVTHTAVPVLNITLAPQQSGDKPQPVVIDAQVIEDSEASA
jgi:hypothetical protein